ncbi:hypothetical protein Hdeb2414_s0020g00566401 [Helianthus debilis subsp. tardiflorus]
MAVSKLKHFVYIFFFKFSLLYTHISYEMGGTHMQPWMNHGPILPKFSILGTYHILHCICTYVYARLLNGSNPTRIKTKKSIDDSVIFSWLQLVC